MLRLTNDACCIICTVKGNAMHPNTSCQMICTRDKSQQCIQKKHPNTKARLKLIKFELVPFRLSNSSANHRIYNFNRRQHFLTADILAFVFAFVFAFLSSFSITNEKCVLALIFDTQKILWVMLCALCLAIKYNWIVNRIELWQLSFVLFIQKKTYSL